MAKVSLIVMKYTFYVAVVFSAGVVIERLSGIKRQWNVDSLVIDDLIYNASSPLTSRNFDRVLSKQYLKCLTEPTKPFCLLSADKRLELFRNNGNHHPSVEEIENRLHNITSEFPSRRRKIHTMLVEFTKLMKTYSVNTILIEPSMLYCLLSSTAKRSMLEKGFNPGRVLGSRNVVTVGVLDDDSKKLEAENLTNEILSAGFTKIKKFRKSIGDSLQKEFETAHYFFVMEDVAVHVVIFYSKGNFLWHAGLDSKEIDFEGLLFVDEGIYENFTLLPLNLAGSSISRFFIPHDVRQFMREIEFAKVVECRTNTSSITTNVEHSYLTREQMNTRAVIVFKELKVIFAPYATFWLWSKSLLGWFTECDVYHFSSNLDLALDIQKIKGLNLTELFEDNEYLNAENNTELNTAYGWKLNCHGLEINIHFLHKDNGFVWHKYGDGEDDVYKYPPFTLCSSEIYGQKIYVPCNTTQVLDVEFRRNGTWNFP